MTTAPATVRCERLPLVRVLLHALKVLAWSVLAILLFFGASCTLAVNPRWWTVVVGPDFDATASVDDGRIRLTVEATRYPFFQAEYLIKLLVRTSNGSRASQELLDGVGATFSRVLLYRAGDGRFAVVTSHMRRSLIETSPLRIREPRGDEKDFSYNGRIVNGVYCFDPMPNPPDRDARERQSVYYKDFEFLGAFEFYDDYSEGESRRRFRFMSADKTAEYLKPGAEC